jgi:hypothetical protein
VSPERVREVQQLWAVALNYLGKSKRLKDEHRKCEDFLAVFRKTRVPKRDLFVLARSADLDSAAIRLASLDELLNGGMKAVRKRAYPGNVDSRKVVWPKDYMHVFLRDAVAHAEPVDGVDEARFTRRQEWLGEQTLAASWRGVVAARDRPNKDIEELCRSAAALDQWMKTDVTRWLGAMKP